MYAVCSVLEKRWKYCNGDSWLEEWEHTLIQMIHICYQSMINWDTLKTKSPNHQMYYCKNKTYCPAGWKNTNTHTHNQIKHQSLIQHPQRIAFALNQGSHVDAFPAPMFSNHLCFQSWDQSQWNLPPNIHDIHNLRHPNRVHRNSSQQAWAKYNPNP